MTQAAQAQARSARPGATPASPPPRGGSTDNLPELITAFYLSQQTGELGVQRGKVKKVVYFETGRRSSPSPTW